MSEYIKLTQVNPEPRTLIYIKVRQVSAITANGYDENVQISMMGGGMYSVSESIDEVLKLLDIDQ